MLARGLKARKADDDGEEYEGLERAMEYTGVVEASGGVGTWSGESDRDPG